MELKQRLSQQLKESRDAFLRNPYPTYQKRLENLNKLESLIKAHQAEIIYAIEQDFGTRSISETGLLELFTSIETIRDAKKQLKKWMKPSRRYTSVWFFSCQKQSCPSAVRCGRRHCAVELSTDAYHWSSGCGAGGRKSRDAQNVAKFAAFSSVVGRAV